MSRYAVCAAHPRQASFIALVGLAILAALAWLAAPGAGHAQSSTEQIEAFVPPAGWQQAEFHGYRFSVPGDWKKVEDRDDGLIFFGGDMTTRTGPAFGMGLSRQDNLLPKDVQVTEERTVRIGASDFRRIEFTTKMDAKTTSNTALYVAPQRVDDRYLVVFNMALNDEFAAHEELYRQMLGTVAMPAADQPMADAGPAVADESGPAKEISKEPMDQQASSSEPAPEKDVTEAAPAGQAAQGVEVNVEGVTFTLPEGWTATTDKPGNKNSHQPGRALYGAGLLVVPGPAADRLRRRLQCRAGDHRPRAGDPGLFGLRQP